MSSKTLKKSNLAQSHHKLAQVLIKQQRWQEAIEACHRAINSNPLFVPAYQSLGELLNQQEDWQGAIKCYQQAIKIKPDLAALHHGLGLALSKQQKWSEAVVALDKATKLNPDFSWSHNSLGEALLRLQKWEEAAGALSKAIELNPNFPWSYYNLGEVLSKLRDWDGVVNAYRSAVKLKPDLPNIQSKLGHALEQQADVDSQAALNCYQEAIKHNPEDEEAYLKALQLKTDDPELYLQYGNNLIKQNRPEEAIFAYNLAIKTQPQNLEFHLKLGKTLIAQGQMEHAIDCYRRALQFNPHAESIQLALGEALVQQKRNLDESIANFQQAVSSLTVNSGNTDQSKLLSLPYNLSNFASQLAPQINLEGCLEKIDGCLLKGWAYNSLKPHEYLILSIYQNDQEILQVLANQFRKDLQESGIGTGNYGFAVRLPKKVCEAAPFDLKIKVKNSDFVLNKSVVKFTYQSPYKSGFQGSCEAIKGAKIKGWALDNNNLDRQIIVSFYEGSQLLNQATANLYRADIQKWKQGGGCCGFIFDIPEHILDNRRHELSFCFENSYVELNNSPVIIEQGWFLPILLNDTNKVVNKLAKVSNDLANFY